MPPSVYPLFPSRPSPHGPLMYLTMSLPAVRCVGGVRPPGALVCVYFRFFFAFFCYVHANIDLGPLFCFIFKAETYVFQYKMRPLLPAVPCVVLCSSGCFRFFCYVHANIDLGPLFCFIFKRETNVLYCKIRPLLPAVPCVVLNLI